MEEAKDAGGYQPDAPATPPTPPQGGTAVVESPLAEVPPAQETAADEKTDEELAASATGDDLDPPVDPFDIEPDPAGLPVTVGMSGLGAVGAIIGTFRPRTLVDPEDLVGRPVAGQPSTIHLEDAMHHWRLEPEDVLGWREAQEVELVIVTAGGKKLRWPDDMDVELTDGERGRPVKPANRVFAEGYLRRDATKDPQA